MTPAGSAAIVFAHGWACDKTVWSEVQSLLEPECKTFAFDAPGFGEREGDLTDPEEWTLKLAVETLCKEVRAAGSERVIVVGASMSGEVSLLAAARHLAQVSGLVAIGASPKHLKGNGYPFGAEASEAQGLMALLRSGYADAIRAVAPAVLLPEEDREIAGRCLEALVAIAGRVRDREKPIRILEKIYAGLDLRESLGKIAIPVLLLHGERDVVAPPEIGRYLEERIPQSRLEVIPGAGHLPHMTAPARVADAIARFALSIS
jgi:sigma-B regulation protein RsbQ